MTINTRGQYQATLENEIEDDSVDYADVCPFATRFNEDMLAYEFLGVESCSFDERLGFYRSLHVGSVSSDGYRKHGSSGGVASWVLATLLENHHVDAVIHVKPLTSEGGPLFAYTVSEDPDSVRAGSGTRYYPVTLAGALKLVRESDQRFAVIAVPCFVKAIRLSQLRESVLRERIPFVVGLVCGHMKSALFTEALGCELGLSARSVFSVDYRQKTKLLPASYYGIRASGTDAKNRPITRRRLNVDLFSYDWGYGFFRYPACNYCDDVVNEVADISIGDAWIEPHVRDPHGTNIVIVRTEVAAKLLARHSSDVSLNEASPEVIAASQAGGFRDRREGLAYRLHLADEANIPRPAKRVSPSDSLDEARRLIYSLRMQLQDLSYPAFMVARDAGNFGVFRRRMMPLIAAYERNYEVGLVRRTARHFPLLRNSVVKLKRAYIATHCWIRQYVCRWIPFKVLQQED